MRHPKLSIRYLLLILMAALLVPSLALAEKGEGKGKGSGKPEAAKMGKKGPEAKAKDDAKGPRGPKGPEGAKKGKAVPSGKPPGPHGPKMHGHAGKGPHGHGPHGHGAGPHGGPHAGKGPRGTPPPHAMGQPGVRGGPHGGPPGKGPGPMPPGAMMRPGVAEMDPEARAAMRERFRERIKARRDALAKNPKHKKALESGKKRQGRWIKERRKHLRRMARINRLLRLAAQKRDQQLTMRIRELYKKERARHKRVMKTLKPAPKGARSER